MTVCCRKFSVPVTGGRPTGKRTNAEDAVGWDFTKVNRMDIESTDLGSDKPGFGF